MIKNAQLDKPDKRSRYTQAVSVETLLQTNKAPSKHADSQVSRTTAHKTASKNQPNPRAHVNLELTLP